MFCCDSGTFMPDAAYRTEIVRLSSGERFPLLIDNRTGLPDAFATAYTLSTDRNASYSTARHHLDAIGLLYEWAEQQGIDLEQRFGSVSLFNSDEIDALSNALRLSRRPDTDVVIPDTHGSRIGSVAHYVKWRGQRVVSRIRFGDDRLLEAAERLRMTDEMLKEKAGSGGSKKRVALTDKQQHFLLSVIRPDAPENPFPKNVRLRNFALIMLYFELGIRRGEALILKSAHVNITGAKPRIQIFRNPNDKADPRKNEPRVKTADRILRISETLAAALDRYQTQERIRVPNYKKTSFAFISVRDGRPMALSTVYDVFVKLRKTYPGELPADFAPHILRHTCNGRFTVAAMGGRTLNPEEQKLVKLARNYFFGWKKHSDQSDDYDRIQIERESERTLLTMQDQLMGLVA
jgi:integrase